MDHWIPCFHGGASRRVAFIIFWQCLDLAPVFARANPSAWSSALRQFVEKLPAGCLGVSEVYPAGKLQWHFTCGFDFRQSLWLPFVAALAILEGLLMVPVGTVGPLWPGNGPFRTVGRGEVGFGWVQSRGLDAWARLAFQGLSCW